MMDGLQQIPETLHRIVGFFQFIRSSFLDWVKLSEAASWIGIIQILLGVAALIITWVSFRRSFEPKIETRIVRSESYADATNNLSKSVLEVENKDDRDVNLHIVSSRNQRTQLVRGNETIKITLANSNSNREKIRYSFASSNAKFFRTIKAYRGPKESIKALIRKYKFLIERKSGRSALLNFLRSCSRKVWSNPEHIEIILFDVSFLNKSVSKILVRTENFHADPQSYSFHIYSNTNLVRFFLEKIFGESQEINEHQRGSWLMNLSSFKQALKRPNRKDIENCFSARVLDRDSMTRVFDLLSRRAHDSNEPPLENEDIYITNNGLEREVSIEGWFVTVPITSYLFFSYGGSFIMARSAIDVIASIKYGISYGIAAGLDSSGLFYRTHFENGVVTRQKVSDNTTVELMEVFRSASNLKPMKADSLGYLSTSKDNIASKILSNFVVVNQ